MAGPMTRAEVMVNNLDEPTENYFGPIGDDSTTNDFLIGQEFTLPSGANPFQINKIALLLSPTGGGANITVSLWDVDVNNNPFSQIAVVASAYVATAGQVDFVPSNSITLSPGIYYVVAAPTTPADSAKVGWYWTLSTAGAGFGVLGGFADTNPGSWQSKPIASGPYQMSIEATPAP